MNTPGRFRTFVADFTRLIEKDGDNEQRVLDQGGKLLAALISHDDWLPDACAQPHPQYYQQYLLHCDPLERFSVVSFVWGPGQKTPVHDHTVWGMVGMMRGSELCRRFELADPGQPMRSSVQEKLVPGQVDKISPTIGDIHEVANAFDDKVSISIHVYGANIGAVKRHVFDAANSTIKDFVSGYSSPTMPNIWDRSAEIRATLAK